MTDSFLRVGVGAQILKDNPVAIKATLDMLDRVVDAGAGGSVIGMKINPHLITMDVLIISSSDANKHTLAKSIPILVKALRMRGEANQKMTMDIVKIFLQLTYEETARAELVKQADFIISFFQKVIVAPKYDLESRQAA